MTPEQAAHFCEDDENPAEVFALFDAAPPDGVTAPPAGQGAIRVAVDFNERDRHGHVVAGVPAALAARLTAGLRVILHDPPERLQAEAVVARVSRSASVAAGPRWRAAFDVDWHSFEDAGLEPREGPWQ